MCRWIAYQGEPIYLDTLVAKPAHSLIAQSLHAAECKAATNGDLNGSKASPRAHKRGRDDAEDEERVAVSGTDPRSQSGGSPVKKRRQGKA